MQEQEIIPVVLSEKEISENQQIVGVEGKGYIKYIVFDDYIEMHSIYVSRDYRRQGIGVKMWEMMKDAARANGFSDFLVVSNTNAPDTFHSFLVKMCCTRTGGNTWVCSASI